MSLGKGIDGLFPLRNLSWILADAAPSTVVTLKSAKLTSGAPIEPSGVVTDELANAAAVLNDAY
ncbi:hypothetical protein D3C86_2054290 [compost metagenome]